MPLSSVIGASSILRPGVCTSTTRPASPFEGQTIYETDTDLVRSWNGSSWVTIGPTTVPPDAVRAIDSAQITTSQSTSSTGYTDLATVGPSVTLTTSTSAIVMFGCRYNDDGNLGNDGFVSYAVSGATTISASDSYAGFGHQGFGGEQNVPLNYHHKVTTLNAGSNTFTLKYRKSGGSSTAGFLYRYLTVVAL